MRTLRRYDFEMNGCDYYHCYQIFTCHHKMMYSFCTTLNNVHLKHCIVAPHTGYKRYCFQMMVNGK